MQAGDPGSTLTRYQQTLRLRRELGGDGHLQWLDRGPQRLVFRRETGLTCAVNFGPQPIELPDGDVLITSVPLTEGMLPPDAAAWLL